MKLRKVKTSDCPFTNSKIFEMTNNLSIDKLSFCQFPRPDYWLLDIYVIKTKYLSPAPRLRQTRAVLSAIFVD